jgi:hypothetical protein
MAFRGKYQIRSKIILNSKTIERVQNFNYVGCDVSFNCGNVLKQKYTNFGTHMVQ